MQCPKCSSTNLHKRGVQNNRQRFICTDCGSWTSEPLESRVLVIPDLHAPFTLKGYLEFVKGIYDKYECNQVIQIGDLFDGHYTSFHSTDPNGYGESEEFNNAVDIIRELHEAFPLMTITLGNHDGHAARKAFKEGINSRWIKTIDQVLDEANVLTPGWDFVESTEVDGVLYTHGTGKRAKQRMIHCGQSVVQGHYHSDSGIAYQSNRLGTTFSMQLGALIDDKAYAFAYAKGNPPTHLNCGVVINGEVPIIEYYNNWKKDVM